VEVDPPRNQLETLTNIAFIREARREKKWDILMVSVLLGPRASFRLSFRADD